MSPDQGQTFHSGTSAIVAAMAAGDEQALGALYDAYGAVAYGLAYAITGTHGAAETAVAAAFADAWRTARSFDVQRTSVLAWVTSLTRRASLAAALSRPRGSGEIARALSGGTRTLVSAALGTLTERQRRVLELSYFRGLSVPEIAAQLGEPEVGTRELLRSAMNDLRSALSPMGMIEDHAVTRA